MVTLFVKLETLNFFNNCMDSLENCLSNCLQQYREGFHTVQEGFDLIVDTIAPFLCDEESDIFDEGGDLLISVPVFFAFLTM